MDELKGPFQRSLFKIENSCDCDVFSARSEKIFTSGCHNQVFAFHCEL